MSTKPSDPTQCVPEPGVLTEIERRVLWLATRIVDAAGGSVPQHLAWTALGAVTIAAWPAAAAWRPSPRPRILSGRSTAIVTAAFAGLLGWLVLETQDGTALGLAERLTSAAWMSWPFVVALALRRSEPAARARGPARSPVQASRMPARPSRSGPDEPG
jgi:hypothetical protein